MNTYEMLRFSTPDGVELCGILSTEPANSRRAVMHTHGLAGNFYEQLFVDYLAAAAIRAGYRFGSFNNRGHDYFSDAFVTAGGRREVLARGGAHERLDEAHHDFVGALSVLERRGLTEVVLSAHSTGAVKLALFIAENRPAGVSGAVFLSPSDDIGIQADNLGDRFAESIEEARAAVAAGRGEELLPDGTFFYPIDARAYLDLFDPDGRGNVFDLTGQGVGLQVLAEIAVPTLVTFGSEDVAVTGNPADAAEAIERALKGSTCHAEVIGGADHNYSGKEQELADLLTRWLDGAGS